MKLYIEIAIALFILGAILGLLVPQIFWVSLSLMFFSGSFCGSALYDWARSKGPKFYKWFMVITIILFLVCLALLIFAR